jgi:hypothetical protein
VSASPARTAQSTLRESVASMGDRQIALAARASGIPRSSLIAFAEGRSGLSELSMRRLGEHLFTGRYLIKREEMRA